MTVPVYLGFALSRRWAGVPALTATVAGHTEMMYRIRTEGVLAIAMIIVVDASMFVGAAQWLRSERRKDSGRLRRD